jgi:hypothetical protein
VKPEKTYEDYLEEKEAAKEERKKLIQIKLACEKDANASGKVSKECTDLIDEKDWDDVDKETEKVEENKSDEKDINGDSDSSSDNN